MAEPGFWKMGQLIQKLNERTHYRKKNHFLWDLGYPFFKGNYKICRLLEEKSKKLGDHHLPQSPPLVLAVTSLPDPFPPPPPNHHKKKKKKLLD